jgi:hypothetical protein
MEKEPSGEAGSHTVPSQAVLASCSNGEACVTFTLAAGKRSSRLKHDEPVMGPTLFWLTCPKIHSFVGHLEFLGAAQFLEEYLTVNDDLRAAHIRSHASFLEKLQGILPTTVYQQYLDKFARDAPGEHELPAVKGGQGATRRYGNAAVSLPENVKCLHALTACALVGIFNPLGTIVLQYLHHLGQLSEKAKESTTPAGASLEEFQHFVEECNKTKGWSNGQPQFDPCECAKKVFLLIQGREIKDRSRKKRRRH